MHLGRRIFSREAMLEHRAERWEALEGSEDRVASGVGREEDWAVSVAALVEVGEAASGAAASTSTDRTDQFITGSATPH